MSAFPYTEKEGEVVVFWRLAALYRQARRHADLLGPIDDVREELEGFMQGAKSAAIRQQCCELLADHSPTPAADAG